MIEIEKKFLLTPQQQDGLLAGARELGSKTVTDSYLDTADFTLTTRDLWFRERDGAYELKVPLRVKGADTTTNRYNEITDRATIIETLGLDAYTDFETSLARAGITTFITVLTDRTSYEKQGFHIDVDAASYRGSDFTYALAEIELLIDDESGADAADTRIMEFARTLKLTTDQAVIGKVGAYLRAERPEHYAALVEAGVF